VRRLSEKLEKSFVAKVKFDKDSDISLKSELVEITVYKSSAIEIKLKKLYDTIRAKDGAFLTITQGINEVMIITNKKYESAILKVFSDDEVKKKISGLSSVTIMIPENAFNTMGLFYLVTRALNWENINIIDIVSTFTEMTFIIKEDDASRAFNCLRELIHKNS
jgi:aspartokinase